MKTRQVISLFLAATTALMSTPVGALAASDNAPLDFETMVSGECLALVQQRDIVAASLRAEDCAYRVKTLVTDAIKVPALGQAELEGVAAAERPSLRSAVAAGSVRSKRYSQVLTGAAWTATQSGTFYFDGQRVWVGSTYRSRTGSHHCNVNYSAGFGLSLQNCSESGSNTQRSMYQSWYVSPLKIGVGWTAGSTVHLHRSGHTSY